MASQNFRVKNGLEVGGVEVVSSDGSINAASVASAVTANDGIISNSAGIFVDGGDGLTVNASGVHIQTGNNQLVANAGGLYIDQSTIDHDLLSNFVANEHIDHSAVYISGGIGLSGSGDLTSNIEISVATGNNQLIANSSGLFIDQSRIDHDSLFDFVSNEHIDHSTIHISGGNGLSGTGDLTSNVTVSVNPGNNQVIANSQGLYIDETNIDHDNLSGFVANEHIDHSTVYVSGGNGLTGSGDITANVSISAVAGNSQMVSNSSGLFITETNIDHDNLSNFVANEHIDHSTIYVSGGNGLTGSGDITANVSISIQAGNSQIVSNSSGLFIDESRINHDNLEGFVANEHIDHSTIYMVPGDGMSGGGDITANVTLSAVGGTGVTSNSSGIHIGQDVSTTANVTFNKLDVSTDVLITGNLTVTGTATQVSSTDLIVNDAIITLASGQTSGALDSGIEVDRGSDANVSIKWNEITDTWQLTDANGSFYDIHNKNVDVVLGTDTSGDYVATLSTGSGLSGSGSGEGSAPTVSVNPGNNQVVANSSGLFIDETNIDHDNLSGFVANEHIDHSGVDITAGDGLTGGGDITTSRTLTVGAGDGIAVNSTATSVSVGNNQLVANSSGLFIDETNIDHDNLSGFVSNEHIDHSGVDITAGDGLAGGGDITASRTLNINPGNNQVIANSSGLFIDESNIDHDNLTGFVSNEHVDHTSVNISAGNGLTGGGDITSSRTLAVGAGNGITVNSTATAVLAGNSQVVANSSGLFIDETNINHDNLSGFVANEHIDHSGVDITAGDGLTGGGDITASRTLTVGAGDGITVNSTATSVQAGNNQLIANSSGLFIDETNIDHDNLSGFVANEHIDHTSVDITAGSGLTGGGDISASRTVSVNPGNSQLVANSSGLYVAENNINHDNLSGFVGNEHIDHSTIHLIAGDAITGGGVITANVTFDFVAGDGLSANSTGAFVVAGNSQVVSNSSGVYIDETNINHDNLSGFVANEHIDHSGVDITAGNGLTGGGDITASRTLTVGAGNGIEVNSTAVAVLAGNSQLVSNSTGVWVDESNINHDNLSGFVGNEHIDHTSVNITAGDGLTGGGDISSSRTLTVGAGNGIEVNSTATAVLAGTGVTSNATGVHIGQDVSTDANVQFAYVTANGVNISSVDAITVGGNSAATLRTYSETTSATAYSNAVSDAASDATTKSDTAYSNAVSYADSAAGTAYSNATSYADTAAGTAYSNATSYADTAAGTAFSNAVSDAASDATTKSDSAYSNAVSYADSIAGTAYSNATSYADTAAGTAYTNATSFSANADNISSGTVNSARLPSANATVQGAIKVLDSVTNTSILIAASANSAKNAYDRAIDANTRAASAQTAAESAYSNATSYADTAAGTAYTNAASYADTAADTAYTNAASYADSAAGTAYSNATSYADTAAGTAYSNATSYADTAAGTAYTNAVSTAASDATTKSDTAYSNATSYADTAAGTAYSNATTFAANADNISSGTLSGARIQANNGVVGNSSGVFVDAGTGVTVNSSGVHIGQDVSTTSDVLFNSAETTGNLVVGGNLTVTGNSVSISTQSLAVKDNMLYMNNGVAANITGITLAGNSTHLIFTADNNFANGWDVSVTGVTPSSFNGTYHDITEANSTHFIVANTNSDSYISGGTARGKTDAHPDLGWAAGYNDGSYAHAGMFRDATDGTFKVFSGYTPEPDLSVYINTSHASFSLANFQANTITANTFSGNGASVTSVNAATVGGNTAATLRTYSDTKAATAYSNATSYADTKAATAYSNATSYADTAAGTAYSNAVSYSDTIAGTAYSNAVSTASSDATSKAATAYSNATSFASNASNISSGTLNNARLPATISVTNVTASANVTAGSLRDSSGREFKVYNEAGTVVWG